MIKFSETINNNAPAFSIREVADNALATFEGKPLKAGQPLFATSFAQKGAKASKFVILLLVEVILKAFSTIGNDFTKAERRDLLETIWFLERNETTPMPKNFDKMLKQPVDGVTDGTSEQERYDAIRSTNENGRSQLAVIQRCHAVIDKKREKAGEYTEANRPLNFQDCLGSDRMDDLRKAVKQSLQYTGDCSNDDLAYIVNAVSAILPNARNSTVTAKELNLTGEYPAASIPTAQEEMAVAAKAPQAA